MRVVILGGHGDIGSRIADVLEARGHDVVRASRSTGVDAYTGIGLDEAVRGADVVVDALNVGTMSARTAIDFFGTCAGNVVSAAARSKVSRIVCVSIAGAADPRVNRLHGYYRGKAAQEQAYAASTVPTTIVHSTQWFELMDDLVRMASAGPVTLLPTMRMAPIAVASAARFVADTVEEGAVEAGTASSGDRVVTIRGAEEATGKEFVRRILAARGSVGGRQPKLLLEVPLLGRAIAHGGLVPRLSGGTQGPITVDPVTVTDWASKASTD